MPSVHATQDNGHPRSLPVELCHLIVRLIPVLMDRKEGCEALLYLALSATCFTSLALDELWGRYQHSLICLLHVLDSSLWMKRHGELPEGIPATSVCSMQGHCLWVDVGVPACEASYIRYLSYAHRMMFLRIGQMSLEPHQRHSRGFIMTPKMFALLMGGQLPDTKREFHKVFPRVVRIEWARDACDKWTEAGFSQCIRFPCSLQAPFLAQIKSSLSLKHLQFAVENNIVLNKTHISHFAITFLHLTSLRLSGSICHLLACVGALPSCIQLKWIGLASLDYWTPDEFLSVFLELERIAAANAGPPPFEVIYIGTHIGEITHRGVNFTMNALGNASPYDLHNGNYDFFHGPLAAIVGPNLRSLIVDPLLGIAFPRKFLDIFLAAPHVEYLDFGTLAGHLRPQSTEVTMADIIRIGSTLSELEVLHIPWTVSVCRNTDAQSASSGITGTGEALSYPEPSPARPKLRELGFPCFYPDRDLCDNYLTLLASAFPALKVLAVFSSYFNEWQDTPLILDFSIECSNVEYL